jgi:uncharacterized protein (DUF2267 family)
VSVTVERFASNATVATRRANTRADAAPMPKARPNRCLNSKWHLGCNEYSQEIVMGNFGIMDRSIQKTSIWLKDAGRELNWRDERKAYKALRAVLHALRDRITVEETVQLGAQLPTFIRGFYYEGWSLRGKPLRDRNKYGFLSEIQKAFGKTDNPAVDATHVARAIFRLLNEKISQGEIDDILSVLPAPLREFWPAPPKARPRKNAAVVVHAKFDRKKAEHTAEELLRAVGAGTRAVAGLSRTLQSLNEGRAWKVLYGEGVRLTGYECRVCSSLFAGDRESCSYCGSPLDLVDNMGTRVVDFAGERGIPVQILRGTDSKELSKSAGGIGAFLKTTRDVKLGLRG